MEYRIRALILVAVFSCPFALAQSLRLNGIEVDKSKTVASADALQKAAGASGQVVVLVQFEGPIQPGWIENIEKLGATVHHYIPEYAYLVSVPATAAGACAKARGVIWVGLQPAETKIAAPLRAKAAAATDKHAKSKLIHVNVLSVDERPAAELERRGHRIVETDLTQMGWYQTDVHLPLSALEYASSLNSVFHIEEFVEPKLHGERGAQTFPTGRLFVLFKRLMGVSIERTNRPGGDFPAVVWMQQW